MILANITILPSWATCAPWNAIVPMPICAAFRSLPLPTARCSRASCHGSAERVGADKRRKPTVRFAAAGRLSVTRSFRKHISFRSCKNAEHRSRLRLRCCVCMGTALRRSPRGTSSTRGVYAGCSKVCIPPICGSAEMGRRRQNEGSAHKDAPRASAPTIKDRQQRAHRPRRAVYSDLAGHIHSGAK